jgi:hypothetical protein
MNDSDREWLLTLQAELHKWVPPQGPRGLGHWNTLRNLTESEWTRLTALLGEGYGLVFTLGTMYGFSLLLKVYEDAPIPEVGPEFLLFFEQKQIPEAHGTTEATLGGAGDSWKEAWKILTKWSHSDRNKQKLEFYGMEPPKDEAHYMY